MWGVPSPFRFSVALEDAAPRTRAGAQSWNRVQMIRARARFIGINRNAKRESKATRSGGKQRLARR